MTCGRLGCKTDKLTRVYSPHSGLMLQTCPPCARARAEWDTANRLGLSHSYALHGTFGNLGPKVLL